MFKISKRLQLYRSNKYASEEELTKYFLSCFGCKNLIFQRKVVPEEQSDTQESTVCSRAELSDLHALQKVVFVNPAGSRLEYQGINAP